MSENSNDWIDEFIELPKEDGVYLCACRFFNENKYQYELIEYKAKQWIVTDSCEHILWQKLPPIPKNV